MIRRWLVIVAGVTAALLLFVICAILLVPDRELQGVVVRGLAQAGYTFRAAQFGKALPIGIKARNLEIADERGVLVKADKAALRLRLLPLLVGKISFHYRATVGAGVVQGDFSPLRGGEFDIEISHLRMEDMPFFQTAMGTSVKGDIQAQGSFQGGEKAQGKAQLEIKGVELAGVKIGGIPLPGASYESARGAVNVGNGKVLLRSFTLQGEGLYVRVSGDFPVITPLGAAPLNLSLELMPKPDFLEKQKFVFLLLAKYLTTPGHYQIPIRGTLAKPALQ